MLTCRLLADALLPLWLLPKNPSSDTVVKCLEAECNAEYKLTELRDAEMQAQLLFQQGSYCNIMPVGVLTAHGSDGA